MAAKKLTKKRIEADISEQCSEACQGAELPMMRLGEISKAAREAYVGHIGGTTHGECLKAARVAADAKVAELRVDKHRPTQAETDGHVRAADEAREERLKR